MNLTIDIGNSFFKLGVFDKNNKVFVSRTPDLTIDFLNEIKKKYAFKKLIYSGVSGKESDISEILKSVDAEIYILKSDNKLPFKVEYLSPETLGTDRLAAVAGAYNKFGDSNVLVIDAGTAITYDLLLASGVYKGGNISPGLSMRFKALHTFTGKLPLVNTDYKYDMIGNTTENAIRAGVQQGLIFEINEYIRNFKINYRGLKIIVTGGDGDFIRESVKYPVEFESDLVIEGLNYILNYNA